MDKKKQKTKSEYTGYVPAVDQASRILLSLAKSSSAKVNLTDICKSVNIYKSKGYAILNTLQKYGFVQKDPEGKTYSLGLGLISLSRKVLDNVNYNEIAAPILETLARKTRSTALLGIIRQLKCFYCSETGSRSGYQRYHSSGLPVPYHPRGARKGHHGFFTGRRTRKNPEAEKTLFLWRYGQNVIVTD